ncbi:alpha-tocopherol transfer protein-like isoform X2 [Leptidea sinapis]|uniref:alpha-tocopherol transfer protein-like isoform X2 n=1 Tax=Leptidea sinapis TaxID=189913 RepID=UPI002140165D|nr:alpha-tocopherol transfer protein-like isoform X2 [Leptidea sinapis]
MPVDLDFDYEVAIKNMDIFSQEHIDNLHDWTQKLDKSKYVPKDLSNKQLLLFYNACEGDIERTKICIERYYNLRRSTPEMFDNRILTTEENKAALEALEYSILPEKSCEGYDMIYHRLYNTEPSKYCFEAGCRILFMTVDACLHKRGPNPGFIFLFDMAGVKLGHITRVGLLSLRKFFQYVQEAMPVRMRAIHVFNTEPVLDKLLLLIRPFIDKKFFDMIKFHHKTEDLTEFYETVAPRSALPSDHGGTLPDMRTLHKKCTLTLQALEPYFTAEEKQRIETLSDKKREKHMEKAFKNLDID